MAKPKLDLRPEVRLTNDLSADTAAVWASIQRVNDPSELFVRGGAGVWLESQDGQILTRDLNPSTLGRFATDRIRFVAKNKKEGWHSALPSERLLRNMLGSPSLPLPPLNGITRVPTFSKNGNLHIEPGYSRETGTLYVPPEGFFLPEPIPTCPSRADVETALEILDDPLHDFPFTTKSSLAHAIAALVLPFVRGMIDGPTPLHLISKPKAGTGATLLAQVLAAPGCVSANLMPLPNDEGECRRAISAALGQMPACVTLDNVHELKSQALASCLTSTVFRDRLVGTSSMLELPNRGLWFATGNNPNTSDEIARRVVWVRIDAKHEHPDQRNEFRHADLAQWVREHRVNLVWAVLTLIGAWVAEGMPSGTKVLGGFESWSRIIGGILRVAGIEGFLDDLTESRQNSDLESDALRGFVEVWAETHGERAVTARELLPLAEGLDLGTGGDNAKRLGKLLQNRKDQRLGQWIIAKTKQLHGYQRWRLREVVD